MKKVLVVDDSDFMRRKMIELLEAIDLEIVGEARNGNDAVKLYKRLKPDLVTMDITMPEMSGRDALMQIMEIDEGANVVMCSTLGSEAIIAECIQEGALAYIIKPYIPSEAQNVILEICNAEKN